MADDVEFEPEAPPESSSPSDVTQKELSQFNKREPKPNSALVPLWRNGHLTFNPENSVAIFALLTLIGLLTVLVIVSIVGAFVGDAAWLDTIMGALGHGISLVIGAIVGGAVVKANE